MMAAEAVAPAPAAVHSAPPSRTVDTSGDGQETAANVNVIAEVAVAAVAAGFVLALVGDLLKSH